MHEMSIAQSLLSIVYDEMQKNNVSKLKKVKVKSGQLNSVMPAALQTAFQALVRDTELQSGELVIETIAIKYKCSDCGACFSPRNQDPWSILSPCPKCGQEAGHHIVSGQELFIEYIEAE